MRSRRSRPDPLAILGLSAGADRAAIVAARRRLAKRLHPDAGGDPHAMQRVNDAADAALAALGSLATPPQAGADRDTVPRRHGVERTDHPSFTIEALPAEAFEALVIVASWLGDVIDDEPPYGLEIALGDPWRGWCRIELVPDAGASSVSLAVAGEPGRPAPDLDEVRDAWVDGLNRLDWSEPDFPRPPS